MKASTFISVITLLIAGCKPGMLDQTSGITGTYVHQRSDEYFITDDTIEVISTDNALIYQVDEHMAYNKIREGKKLARQFRSTTVLATWDEGHGLLSETNYGKQYLFDPQKYWLVIGKIIYQKIK